jgi:hypothetical protein
MNPDTSSRSTIDRRTFVKGISAAGLGIALAPGGDVAAAEAPTEAKSDSRKRYAIVGTGSRHAMYRDAIVGDYKQHAQLVAMCDINPGRLELSCNKAKAAGSDVRDMSRRISISCLPRLSPMR